MAEVTERRERGTARDIARRVLRYENATLGIILASVMGALAVATGGKSIAVRNMKMIVVQGATMGVGAIGQMFVILTAGIDLSVAGMAFGTSALGSSMMCTELWRNILVTQNILGYTGPASIWVGVPAMLAMGVGLGAISGLVVSRIGVPPFIATLGMWQVAHGIGFFITGGFTIPHLIDPLRFFGQRFIYGFPVAGIIWIVVGAIVYFVLRYTTYARSIYATGSNPVSAWLSGVNVKNTQLSVYMISGFTAALGGLIRTGRVMSVSYTSFDFLELQTIASAVIGGASLFGGKGTLIGVVLGALVITVILNGMTILRADPFLESLVLGVIVIAAVAVDYWRGR
ncbi:MAG: ABC transporter permease [Dehalococcoidia bacterium]|nr:MAG: ABC transporter permease [Dehalococcoidia bacterium]